MRRSTNFVLPSLEREIRKELTEEALGHAIEIFARNFRSLLLDPAAPQQAGAGRRPRHACGTKVVALDERGTPLEDVTAHPLPPQNKVAEAKAAFTGLIRKHGLQVIAIGNGSMCREMEQIISDLITELEAPADGQPAVPELAYVIANEAGAADYSDSPVAREEFPNADRMTRGTIAIGRRLQDPLAELVKIDPQHVGVGLYQHDVKPKHLKESIDEVIESCVNEVGVDVNTRRRAAPAHVSGLNPPWPGRSSSTAGPTARSARGPAPPGAELGDARFTQAAAFLKVRDGDDPLDASWVHPESYAAGPPAAGRGRVHRRRPARPGEAGGSRRSWPRLNAGRRGRADGRPRADGPGRYRRPVRPVPRPAREPAAAGLQEGHAEARGPEPGMELKGTVVNVVDFGAFVDIGLKDTGLVHISRMANQFIKNPYEVVGVGDVVPSGWSRWTRTASGPR